MVGGRERRRWKISHVPHVSREVAIVIPCKFLAKAEGEVGQSQKEGWDQSDDGVLERVHPATVKNDGHFLTRRCVWPARVNRVPKLLLSTASS